MADPDTADSFYLLRLDGSLHRANQTPYPEEAAFHRQFLEVMGWVVERIRVSRSTST
jgi:hypothetical protein